MQRYDFIHYNSGIVYVDVLQAQVTTVDFV